MGDTCAVCYYCYCCCYYYSRGAFRCGVWQRTSRLPVSGCYYYSRGAFRCGWDDYLITSRPPTARCECLFTFPSAWSGVALVP